MLVIIICIFLTIVTLSVYWQVIRFDFIWLDDSTYVANNNFIKQGICFDGIRWAFSEFYAANWHPMTWVSHMLDVQLFGVKPGMHHLTNLIFHIINAMLLFLVLERMTGAMWRSAVVAGLFALHPLHVESVAWISERKDVLSAFFWILTMMGYHCYIQKRTVTRYLIIVLFFVLGLLSKPMLVTLPFALLLLDYWPLNQLRIDRKRDNKNGDATEVMGSCDKYPNLSVLLLEKIPLMVLAMISCGVTLFAQKSGGAIRTISVIGLGERVGNAISSYIVYLGKMLCPVHLTIFYPYPDVFHPLWVILCALLLLIISAFVLLSARRFPYLVVGWFWYIGTLIPVIGILQVGDQSMADRYTYIPLVGIFLMIVWGLKDIFDRLHSNKYFVATVTIVVFILLSVASWRQVSYWKNNEALFRHALAVTKNNYLAHGALGGVLIQQGNADEGIKECQEAIRINPYFYPAYFRLGEEFTKKKDYERASEYYAEGLKIKPDDILALNYLGDLFAKTGKTHEAIIRYSESLQIFQHQPVVYNNLGNVYLLNGDIDKATEYYQDALYEEPNNSQVIKNLKNARVIKEVQKLLKANPQNINLYTKLGDIYGQLGGYDKAISQYQKAISIQPKSTQAMNGLVIIYSNRQEYHKALDVLMNMQKIQPNNPDIYYNISCIYAKQKMIDQSVNWLKQSVGKGFHNWELIENDPDLEIIRNTSAVNELIKNH